MLQILDCISGAPMERALDEASAEVGLEEIPSVSHFHDVAAVNLVPCFKITITFSLAFQ